MDQYRVLSQAELSTELVQGDEIDLVYDFGSANPYWLGIWGNEVDKALRKVSIYDVTGFTNNGDGTLTFHVTIKPFVIRVADGACISVADVKILNDAAAKGQEVQLLKDAAESASAGTIIKVVAVAVLALAIVYSLHEVRLMIRPETQTKPMLQSVDEIVMWAVIGLALWLGYEVFLKDAK